MLLATDWLLCTGPLAAAYVLKREQMAGNGDISPKMCDAQTIQHWRDHPEDVTKHVQCLLDAIGDVRESFIVIIFTKANVAQRTHPPQCIYQCHLPRAYPPTPLTSYILVNETKRSFQMKKKLMD